MGSHRRLPARPAFGSFPVFQVLPAVVAVASCLVLLPAVPVGAALVSTGPAKVARVSGGAEQVIHSEIALSRDGSRATAVWTVSRYDLGLSATRFTLKAASAVITNGSASWGATSTLVSDSPSDMHAVDVDLSDDGTRALVAWSRDKDGLSTYVVEARTATISGTPAVQSWSPVDEVSPGIDDDQHPVVDLNASGSRGLIAWRHITDPDWSILIATVANASTTPTWGDPVEIATDPVTDPTYDYIKDLTVAISSTGISATVGWVRSYADGDDRVQSSSGTFSATTSTWGAITTLASGDSVTGFDLDLSVSGSRATAVWSRTGGCGECTMAASADIDEVIATWGEAAQASPVGSVSNSPEVEVSADGSRAVAVWQTRGTGAFLTSDGIYQRPEMAVATISTRVAAWGDPAFLSDDEVPTLDPVLQISDDASSAIVAWMSYNPSGVTPVTKPYISSVTMSGTSISPVNSRSIGKASRIPSVSNLRLTVSADATRAVAQWIVDVDNGSGDVDVMQVGVMGFQAQLDPSISSVSPTKGPVTGGTEVTITGSNFVDVEDVSFGFDSAEDFTVVSDTEIVATAPEGDRIGKVSITVTTAAGEVTRKNAFDYIKGPLPKIAKLTPAVGGLAVEDEITITGANFFAPEVRIGGKEADMVEYVSSTEIIVRVPVATKLGAVDVSVKTLSGMTVRSDGFTYVVVPAKPAGVSVEADGDELIVRWGRLRSSQVAIEVTCTNKADGSEITAQVGKNSTSASINGVDSGTYTCVVQGVGRGGAMGMPSPSRRFTVA